MIIDLSDLKTYRYLAKTDDIYELHRTYERVDKEVETAKGRRIALVYIGFFIVTMLFFFSIGKPSNIGNILMLLLISLLVSSIVYFLLLSVFSWLFARNQQDNERRERIKLRILLAEMLQD